MKKLFISLFAAWLLPLAVQAQYLYTTNSGTITITGYTGTGGTVIIPNTINGHPVTSIGDYAFQYNNTLTNLIVGTNVLSIGRNTFAYNTNLTTVTIPNSVTNIVGGAFYDCTNLVNITLGNGVATVGDSAFALDASLVELYFQGNAPNFISLTSVFFGVNGATIYYNSGTTGWAASYDALPAVELDLALQAQFAYVTNGGAITITGYTGPGGTLTIPDLINGYPVTSIADDAFWYNNNLTNLIIGNKVLSIGVNSFAFSTNLACVIIPNSVTNIGGGAFQNCTNLVNITIGKGVLSVGGSAFAFDASLVGLYFQGNAPTFVSLTSVFYAVHGATIYYNVGTSGWSAGYDALSTKTIQSQFGYTTNGSGLSVTITNYTGLGGTVAIPAAITSLPVTGIGSLAFFNMPVTNVTIPNSVISIGSYAFDACSTLASITIPNSVTSLGDGAFTSCPGLTAVNLPNSVTRIGQFAFGDCTGLKGIIIPSSVTSIGIQAFYNCPSLANVTIPNSVTSIGDSAFYSCTALTIVILPSSVTSLGSAPFVGCTSLFAILVAPQNEAYTSVDGVLFDKTQTALIEYPGGLTGAYDVPNGTTSIGESAFQNCHGLTSVTIPDSVANIGDVAFLGCYNLSAITVASQNPAYASTNGVLFNKNQTTLIAYPGGRAGTYVIPNSVTSLGEDAFFNCAGLTGITIPNGITSIGADMFSDCTSLASITIPNSVTSIGNSAFFACPSLTRVTLPNSVTSIGDYAFAYCGSLTNLLFQGNAPALGGPNALVYDNAAAKVYYLAGATGWGPTYGGLPTIELYVPILRSVSLAGGFGFSITGITNITVVVEASTNLINWLPIQTNSTTPFQFNDSNWTSYPDRFYRVRYAP